MTISPAAPAAVTLALATERPDGLPAGITVEDAKRIAVALSAAHAQSTRTVYAHMWRVWERWCAHRDVPALPADPAALAAYLVERAASGIAVSSLDLACTAIRHVRRTHGLPNPAEEELVRQVRQVRLGLRRIYGTAPRRQARPLTVPEIRQIITAIDRTTPIAALAAWRKVRGDQPGALFTRIWFSRVSTEPLGNHVVARMLRNRAVAAGLDGTRITAHPLRAGHATTAALAGVPLTRIAAQTRHNDLGVLVNRCIRPLEALATTSSRDLGL
jgi:integrase